MGGSTTGINTGPPSAGTTRPPLVYDVIVKSVDPEGKIGVTRFTINFLGIGGAQSVCLDTMYHLLAQMAQAFQPTTYCQIQDISLVFRVDVAATKPLRIDGAAQNIEDKAYVELVGDYGAPRAFQIPAPVPSIFLADGETVNPSSTYMQGLLGGIMGGINWSQATVPAATYGVVVTGGDGDTILSYVKGYRRRARTRRRLRQGISTEIGG